MDLATHNHDTGCPSLTHYYGNNSVTKHRTCGKLYIYWNQLYIVRPSVNIYGGQLKTNNMATKHEAKKMATTQFWVVSDMKLNIKNVT